MFVIDGELHILTLIFGFSRRLDRIPLRKGAKYLSLRSSLTINILPSWYHAFNLNRLLNKIKQYCILRIQNIK